MKNCFFLARKLIRLSSVSLISITLQAGEIFFERDLWPYLDFSHSFEMTLRVMF